MDRGWSIRAYENGDEEAMFELYCAVYGEIQDKNQWMRRWNWKYKHNPAGSPVIWLAESGGKLVGQYPINCVTMKIGKKVLKGSQMVELMTHPDYQRRGMFLALARQALGDAGSKGIDITYGFPNKPAYPGHLKSGFFDVGALSTMIKPLNLENILRKYITNGFLRKICAVSMNFGFKALYRTQKAPKVNGLTITQVQSFDERINDLWEKVSNDYEIIVVRDKKYLNWRYVDITGVHYTIYLAEKEGQILGYTVLMCEKQQGLIFGRIFDLIVPLEREAVARSLIQKAIEFFEEEKADLVLYRIIGNKAYYKTLRESGFINSRFIGRKERFIVRSNVPKISETFIREHGHWFVQTGDSDAI